MDGAIGGEDLLLPPTPTKPVGDPPHYRPYETSTHVPHGVGLVAPESEYDASLEPFGPDEDDEPDDLDPTPTLRHRQLP